MRAISLILSCACLCAHAQVIMGGSGTTKQGISFRYETRVEPEIAGQKLSGFGAGGLVVANQFHRYLTDSTTHTYFGYDLAIDPTPEGRFRVTFSPLSLNATGLELDQSASWTQLPLPPLPAPIVVTGKDHDLLAVTFLVHPVTGQKVTDYLSIGDDRFIGRLPTGEPRDFTINDVPLTLVRPRLSVNGKLLKAMGGGISGEAVYLYLPGQGRYAFSLAPNTQLGFHRSGEVRGQRLSFQEGAARITFDCEEPVAPGGGVFHLYVRHDPAWRPRGTDELHLGASFAAAMVRRP